MFRRVRIDRSSKEEGRQTALRLIILLIFTERIKGGGKIGN